MAIMLILSENASPLHHDKMAFFNDYLDEFKKRVFDPSFPNKYKYAEILVEKIPTRKLVNVACVYHKEDLF